MRTNRSFLPELPSLFDDFITRDLFGNWQGDNSRSLPAVNIRDTENSYELEVAAPGMDKKDFKVELDQNRLVISAERQEKKEDRHQDGNYSRREFQYQNFMRTFSLPENMVEEENISATYTDGILHITIPKSEKARKKPVKMIEIS